MTVGVLYLSIGVQDKEGYRETESGTANNTIQSGSRKKEQNDLSDGKLGGN